MTFADNLDPDEALCNVAPRLISILFDTLIIMFWQVLMNLKGKIDLEKITWRTKSFASAKIYHLLQFLKSFMTNIFSNFERHAQSWRKCLSDSLDLGERPSYLASHSNPSCLHMAFPLCLGDFRLKCIEESECLS